MRAHSTPRYLLWPCFPPHPCLHLAWPDTSRPINLCMSILHLLCTCFSVSPHYDFGPERSLACPRASLIDMQFPSADFNRSAKVPLHRIDVLGVRTPGTSLSFVTFRVVLLTFRCFLVCILLPAEDSQPPSPTNGNLDRSTTTSCNGYSCTSLQKPCIVFIGVQ